MQTRRTRRNRKSKRGGNYSLASLGQAASNLLIPAGLFYAAKRQQNGRSVRRVLRHRKY
jgi:hypothetical protein